MVSCPLSSRMLAVVCAAISNSLSGKLDGISMPVARTTRPAGTCFISMGGSGSGTSCQLFGASVSSLSEPRPSAMGLAQDVS